MGFFSNLFKPLETTSYCYNCKKETTHLIREESGNSYDTHLICKECGDEKSA